MNRALGAAVGVAADRLIGEPPRSVHPVVGFGRIMRAVERGLYADDRGRGVVHAALGVAVGAGAGALVGSTAAATFLAVGGRALGEAALAVGDALADGDLDRARTLLPALVGRDPGGLDEKEIARAVVESVAENTVDAVVAPALWAAVGGAAGALGYRAVNTMDAMVGHRSPRYGNYGWAGARLDDLAGWVPARVTAALVAAVRPRGAGAVWTAVRDQAPAHPSPNAGVAEAAFAAALGLRLGGENRYGDRIELRPPLGIGRPPEPADIGRAIALSRDVAGALGALLVVKSACTARITTRNAPGRHR
ncbi:MAG TPA: adenosylcobinamide-phosphate synthase CbiB [Acidimicrobiales bacterium]|nr:adenosylcobinamide-phosphate synthase CbiB [Acidimicrobiales bacterium]